MKKVSGYVLLIAGLAVLASGVKPVNEQVISYVPLLKDINPFILMGVGIGILVVGVLSMRGSSSGRTGGEVPIYHGKNVVGYRRMGM